MGFRKAIGITIAAPVLIVAAVAMAIANDHGAEANDDQKKKYVQIRSRLDPERDTSK